MEIERERCERMSFHLCVMGILGFMVKDPPLAPGDARADICVISRAAKSALSEKRQLPTESAYADQKRYSGMGYCP